MNVKKIALFASGSGTNVQNIIEYFIGNEFVVVDSVWCNNPKAYVIERAVNFEIDVVVFNREQFYHTNEIVNELKKRNVDLLVLAGFLWLIPDNLVKNFTIINIHPALLPKYGGKGMYGMNVHKAVVENKEIETGISVHYVNERYDEGEMVFQAKCTVEPSDSPEIVAEKVHKLEYEYFPRVIETVVSNLSESK